MHDRVRELLKLAKTSEFMKSLKEAHAPTPERPAAAEDGTEDAEENQEALLEELER